MPPLALGPILIDNPIWLYGLLSLIPLIILYLIKPKPRVMEIPSLMFFMQTSGHRKLTSFLKNFIRDLLFLIQFLLLLFLASSIAQPYTKYDADITAANTILVVDASASSQAKLGGSTRFAVAIDKAEQLLGSRNTIILAKDVPLIAIQDATEEKARDFLRTLRPRDTGTNIGDAILLAGEALSGREGRVIALSDFIHTSGMAPLVAKGALQSKGITTDFVTLAGGQKLPNIGFSDINVDERSTILYVTNYDDEAHAVTVTGQGLNKQLTLDPRATEPVPITTPAGISKFQLEANDALPADDVAYISAPEQKTIRVHLITNNASVFLKNALTSSDIVQLTISQPPIVSQENFDVTIVDTINQREVLPGTYEELTRRAEQGGTVIINAQQASDAIDYKDLLPVKITGRGTISPLTTQQVTTFTRNIDFSRVSSYFQAEPKSGTIPVLTAIGNATVIGIQPRGQGKVVYYGILEKESDFKISPYYPIFWQELLKYATDRQDIRTLNQRIGSQLVFDESTTVKTPVGTVKTRTLLLEYQGIYELPDRKIAVNLLNERESDINPVQTPGQAITDYQLRPVTETKRFPLEIPLILAASALLLLELVYIKRRGDV